MRRSYGGIGATLLSVLGLAGHDLGERESEQREREREQRRGMWLGVAQDSEKESRQ